MRRRTSVTSLLSLLLLVLTGSLFVKQLEMINARKPHFLEVFLPNLSSERLEVPSKFIEHLKGITSGALSLTGPSGNSWHVKLIDHKGHLFFHDGWPTFVKDHSIQCGDSLVFRYDGNSHFTVQIFDQSSCEKVEALNAKCSQGSINSSGNLCEKRRREAKAPFLNVIAKKKHPGTSIPVQHDLPAGLREKDLDICTNDKEYISSTKKNDSPGQLIVLGLPCSSNTEWMASIVKPYSKKKSSNSKNDMTKPNVPINTSISKFIESRAAEYFTSSSPYFIRVMNYSNISGNSTMKIPIRFSEAHFPNCRIKVTLKNLNGDCWMTNSVPTAKKSSTMHTFCGGWLAFVRGNGLKIEDVCIFELVGMYEMLVRILRLGVEGLDNQMGHSSIGECGMDMIGRPLESAANVTQDTSGDPISKDVDILNDLHMYDHHENEKNTEKMLATQQEARNLFCTSGEAPMQESPISSASSPLSRTCDECTDKSLLSNAEGSFSNERSRENEVEFQDSDTVGKQPTVEEATASLTFTSPFPSFMKVMMNSNVGGSFTLAVPRTFSVAHLPSHKTEVVLRNMKGNCWNVVSTRSGNRTKFCGGWTSFVRNNGVKVGDVCIFELVDEKVLQVRVFERAEKGQECQSNDVADASIGCTVLSET